MKIDKMVEVLLAYKNGSTIEINQLDDLCYQMGLLWNVLR